MKQLFSAGKPVTGSQLVGRKKIISQIIQWLDYGESVVIIAPRRFGKTSLVREILRRTKKDYFTSFVDFFSTPDIATLSTRITEEVLTNKKLNLAFHKFRSNFSELLKNVKFKQIVNEFEYILSFSDGKQNDMEQLGSSLEFINSFAKKYDQKMICGFDEFGDLRKLNGDSIVKLFRSKIQMHNHTSYLFTGSYESVMSELFFKPIAPFYRFARIMQLKEIDIDIFHKHIQKQFNSINLKIDDNVLANLLAFTRGHPYYTQLLCQQIELSGEKKIDDAFIKKVISHTIWLEINYIEKLWGDLSSKKGYAGLLKIIANGASPYKELSGAKINIARVLRDLKEQGVIQKYGSQFQFIDPLFAYWIKENI